MKHVKFMMDLYEVLPNGWEIRDVHAHDFLEALDHLFICIPTYSVLHYQCVLCNDEEPH